MYKIPIVFILFLLMPAVALGQPVLFVPEHSFDFGNVTEGETKEHIFEFVNTGDQDLVIERLVAS